MYKGKSVSVIIPTYNEAESIKNIIDRFFATGIVDEAVVIDNNALGNTREEVSKTKARMIHEKKQGYGFALMRGLTEAKGDLLVMCEADGTSDPEDINKFVLYSDEFDAVFSTRTSRAAIFSGAFMPFPVRFGNWAWAKFVQVLFNGPGLTDIGCTYKLLSRSALNKVIDLFPLSKGDGKFSPELIIWILRRKIRSIEIPVMFRPRVGKSMYTGSIWKAAKLGFFELLMIIRYRFKKI